MTDKEKLVELIAKAKQSMRGERGLDCDLAKNMYLAEHLIANGVTMNGREIQRLKEENANLCIAINTLEEINRDLILRIESKKAHGWISVEERLPDNEDVVLCVTKNNRPFVCRYDHYWKHWRVSGRVTVTHWMPLPPAPKGE